MSAVLYSSFSLVLTSTGPNRFSVVQRNNNEDLLLSKRESLGPGDDRALTQAGEAPEGGRACHGPLIRRIRCLAWM